jgi:hypothetical protein
MTEVESLQASLHSLAARLEGSPQWPALRAIYLDLAPYLGPIQAALHGAERVYGSSPEVLAAGESFDAFKAGLRQVGLDIRLASEGALAVGLHQCVQLALETLDTLSGLDER